MIKIEECGGGISIGCNCSCNIVVFIHYFTFVVAVHAHNVSTMSYISMDPIPCIVHSKTEGIGGHSPPASHNSHMAGSKGMLVWNSDDDERWGEIDGMDDLGGDESEEEVNN